MNFFIAIILPILVFANERDTNGGGTVVKNGGDVVLCQRSTKNKLDGFYNLDYLLGGDESELAAVKSWRESLFRIQNELLRKVPELSPYILEFSSLVLNTDKSQKQVWEPTPFTLRDIKDEDLPMSIDIPENCREGGKLRLAQAVARQKPGFTGGSQIVYRFMPELFEKLEKEEPLQLSFLLVHEFLWAISDNVERNRRINWLLHSKELEKMSRIELIAKLKAMGLDVQALPRIVAQDGSGHFRSLQEALAASLPNETLILREGRYSTGGAPILQGLKLRGDGKAENIIVSGTNTTPAIEVNAPGANVSFENLSFERNSDVEKQLEPVVWLQAGGVFFRHCRFGSDRYASNTLIRLSERGVSATIEENTFLPSFFVIFAEYNSESDLTMRRNHYLGNRAVWKIPYFKGNLVVEETDYVEIRGGKWMPSCQTHKGEKLPNPNDSTLDDDTDCLLNVKARRPRTK